MVALKNRTVETKSLKSYIGKRVSFTDEKQEIEGEVMEVTVDGYLLVNVDDETDYQLMLDEINVINNGSDDEEEEVIEETEEVEEPASPVVEIKKEEVKEEEIIAEKILVMSLTQIKQFIREQGIKGIPLQLWQKEKELKALVIEKLGLRVEKKFAAVKAEKKETKIVTTKTKKKKEKVKKEKLPRKESLMDKTCKEVINLLKEKSMTKEELFEITSKNASRMTVNFCINFVITVTKALGILKIHEGKKYSL